jgi:arsenical pump membrane protein
VYACTHLANSASLLLPVSNLTNLLAFRASGLSFAHFGALMALPWAVAIAVEWFAFRGVFRDDLAAHGRTPREVPPPLPWTPIAVLAFTLAGFVAAWPAAAGAVAMVAFEGTSLRAVDLPLLGFVLGLGVIVRAVAEHGLGTAVDDLLPGGTSLAALLGAAALAAVLANLLNNVPALLVMLPAAAAAGPPIVLAVLIGVNCGPNLTYTGSLATLLWRRVLREREAEPPLGEFLRLGAITVPPILVLATVALWLVS